MQAVGQFVGGGGVAVVVDVVVHDLGSVGVYSCPCGGIIVAVVKAFKFSIVILRVGVVILLRAGRTAAFADFRHVAVAIRIGIPHQRFVGIGVGVVAVANGYEVGDATRAGIIGSFLIGCTAALACFHGIAVSIYIRVPHQYLMGSCVVVIAVVKGHEVGDFSRGVIVCSLARRFAGLSKIYCITITIHISIPGLYEAAVVLAMQPVGGGTDEGKACECTGVSIRGGIGEGGDGGIVCPIRSLVELVISHQAGFRAGEFAIHGSGNVFSRASHAPDAHFVHAALKYPGAGSHLRVVTYPYLGDALIYGSRGGHAVIQYAVYINL